jgi:hypothetical protein
VILVNCFIIDVDVLTLNANSKLFDCFERLFMDENQVCTIVYYAELGSEYTCDIR